MVHCVIFIPRSYISPLGCRQAVASFSSAWWAQHANDIVSLACGFHAQFESNQTLLPKPTSTYGCHTVCERMKSRQKPFKVSTSYLPDALLPVLMVQCYPSVIISWMPWADVTMTPWTTEAQSPADRSSTLDGWILSQPLSLGGILHRARGGALALRGMCSGSSFRFRC